MLLKKTVSSQYTPMKKLIPIILIACLHHAEVSGQNSGDYQTRATGNWNSYTVWQQYDGSKWNNCTANSQCPGYNSGIINTKVTIRSGHTITAKYNLTGNSAGILEVAAGGTLNMGTSYTINTFGSTIISGSLTTKKEISTNSLIITGILSSSAC
jgi:hypothetical protein